MDVAECAASGVRGPRCLRTGVIGGCGPASVAMVIGWEALIVLQDLRGLTPDEQAEVSTWAARALIQAALHDQPETPRADDQRPPAQQAGPHPAPQR